MRIRTHTNPFSCQQRFEKQNWQKIWKKFNGKLDLEIGFGRGCFLLHYAQENPNRFIVGVDVRKRTVEILEDKIKERDIPNIYPVFGNGAYCLEDMFEDKTIENIFIFHPDPWLKKSHHKRRLINQKFLEVVKSKLKNSGKIFISTDVEPVWTEIQETFSQNKSFIQKEDKFWQEVYQSR